MKRKIYDKLLEWKKKHKGNTALIYDTVALNDMGKQTF